MGFFRAETTRTVSQSQHAGENSNNNSIRDGAAGGAPAPASLGDIPHMPTDTEGNGNGAPAIIFQAPEPPNLLLCNGREWTDISEKITCDQRIVDGFITRRTQVNTQLVCQAIDDFNVRHAFELSFPLDYFKQCVGWTNRAIPQHISRFTVHEWLKCIGFFFQVLD